WGGDAAPPPPPEAPTFAAEAPSFAAQSFTAEPPPGFAPEQQPAFAPEQPAFAAEAPPWSGEHPPAFGAEAPPGLAPEQPPSFAAPPPAMWSDAAAVAPPVPPPPPAVTGWGEGAQHVSTTGEVSEDAPPAGWSDASEQWAGSGQGIGSEQGIESEQDIGSGAWAGDAGAGAPGGQPEAPAAEEPPAWAAAGAADEAALGSATGGAGAGVEEAGDQPAASGATWGTFSGSASVDELAAAQSTAGSLGNGAAQAPLGSRGALLSPVVRRLISEHNLDPALIPGTGMGGRITREDVLRYLDVRGAAAPVEEVPAEGISPTDVAPPTVPFAGFAAEPAGPESFESPEAFGQVATAAPASSPSEDAGQAVSVPEAPEQAPAFAEASAGAAPPAEAPPAESPPAQALQPAAVPAAGQAAPPASEGRHLPAPTHAGLPVRDEVIPFSTIRRVTAEHMSRSKQVAAHTLVSKEVDFENVERLRKRLKERFKESEGVSLTYLPFIARAVIDMLRSYPHLNASVGDNTLIVHHDLHLGIAVDLEREGLMVPVIHHADGQSLRGLARSIADLAARARSRKLTLDDISGGTFTITNPGPFGTLMTYPIIAQPQVAILSTDSVRRRPVVVELPDGTESIAIHSVGILALAFDHRAVDGAYAAAFLHDVGKVIETRDWHAELASGADWA
ncbi:MAG TPA: dihydrolipoamide acetyltransferase family protein, partial [Acidimicrobiales bacterium]|nr:dihydrolipoamide acetyltransferase family protein [Acidimicrobiales bacterium]